MISKIRYLVEKRGANGLPRFFWQPKQELVKAGWKPRRIPADYASHRDARALRVAAVLGAEDLNRQLDAWRSGILPGEDLPKPPRIANPRSLAALIADYKKERYRGELAELKPLADATRRIYDQCLDYLEAWGGKKPVAELTPKDVKKLYAPLYRRAPARANQILRQLRIILGFAVSENWVTINVAAKPGLIGLAKSGVIWPRDAVKLFVAAADTLGHHSIGTAVTLNEWLGQRENDVLAFRRSRLRQGSLLGVQNKTGAGVRLPIHLVDALTTRLEDESARQAKLHGAVSLFLITCERSGEPWSQDDFRHAFAEIRAALALEHSSFALDYLPAGAEPDDEPIIETRHLLFRHLRHTAIVRLAEAGADIPAIAAVSGHSIKSVHTILEHYCVRTGELAAGAFAKRLAKERGE